MNRRTKALAIPKTVKEAVFERDRGVCVLCGSYLGEPVAHVIRRSRGGLGIEKNIVTLCPRCHREYDEGRDRNKLYVRLVAHLKGFYPDWNKEDMVYRKENT